MKVLAHQLCIKEQEMFPSNCNLVKRWWDEQTWDWIECGMNCSNGYRFEGLSVRATFVLQIALKVRARPKIQSEKASAIGAAAV